MSGQRNGPTWKIIVLLGIISVVLFAIVTRGPMFNFGSGFDREDWPDQFQSNGEKIYFTGTSLSGDQISATGGGLHSQMHMQMHQSGCVTCHGADRKGRRLMPKFWNVAPPLTPAALFDAHDGPPDNDGHGDHDKYNAASLRLAITQGIDPAGAPLDQAMPRWSMSAQDLTDLIAFLKSPARAPSQ
jgi:cytochrome c oxidase subunit II